MSKVLVQQATSKNDKNHVSSKSNDYIFKRYRYEQNTILDSVMGKDSVYRDHDYVRGENKENDLERFKREVLQRQNQFDVVDLGEDEDVQEIQEQGEMKTSNKGEIETVTCQVQDDEQDHNQKVSDVKRRNQEFDLKPMDLVDFGEDEEEIDQDQQQALESQQCSGNRPQHGSKQVQFSNPNSSFVSSLTSKYTNDSFIISPNQTIDANLEETFIKKSQKKQNEDQVVFSPQNIGTQQYQIHKLSQNENPFEDAMGYSNDDELKGVKIHSNPLNEDVQVEIIDKDLFVSSKIPPGVILKCKLKKSSGFFNLMSPEYDLYLQNKSQHLISARKNMFRNRELFQLSTQVTGFQTPIRTLMANVIHNTYWLVDEPKYIDKKKISYIDLLIEYKPLQENSKKEREMTVLCPPTIKTYHVGLEYDMKSIDFEWFKRNIGLRLYFRPTQIQVPKSSHKNFELIDSDEEDQEQSHALGNQSKPHHSHQIIANGVSHQMLSHKSKYYYLKMQKQSQNVFDIQIQHPLTPLQAMAIILTRFDAQLK